ncbi:hypothetical protein M8C21_014168, partial [Ambrosia artemisiifolia]
DHEVEKANLALIVDRYKESFTSLPQEKGWLGETLYLYQGYWYPSITFISIATVMASQDTFQAKPTDIYLVTQPKSGTTWIKALAFAIVNRTRYNNKCLTTHPLLNINPHDCVPFIESEILRSKPTYMDENSTRLFATHMPYNSLPQSILDSGCRLVYMCRNPKDVLGDFSHDVLKLEDAFEKFSKGIGSCYPYWDHVKGYYKASLEHPTRILFLTYENMKMDTANNVKRLADFIGYPFTKEEEDNGVVQEIVSLCSFKSLSDVNKHGKIVSGVPSHAFFREGEVEDWKKHLTKEMTHILDEITKEKFHGLDISF